MWVMWQASGRHRDALRRLLCLASRRNGCDFRHLEARLTMPWQVPFLVCTAPRQILPACTATRHCITQARGVALSEWHAETADKTNATAQSAPTAETEIKPGAQSMDETAPSARLAPATTSSTIATPVMPKSDVTTAAPSGTTTHAADATGRGRAKQDLSPHVKSSEASPKGGGGKIETGQWQQEPEQRLSHTQVLNAENLKRLEVVGSASDPRPVRRPLVRAEGICPITVPLWPFYFEALGFADC
jgi:hypothetical protein